MFFAVFDVITSKILSSETALQDSMNFGTFVFYGILNKMNVWIFDLLKINHSSTDVGVKFLFLFFFSHVQF